ncbi:MAG TPA: transcriptional repressor [Syntrophobacteraceae bacterium]|nr:transcriptional repressor [Syntrophobacteraceae bacterium]
MHPDPDRMAEIVTKLRAGGHRITPQRLAILRMLIESRSHPSVEDIFEKVKVNFPTTSLATIYKTIAVMKELGEVLELEFSTGHNRYDGSKPYPHPHLICVKCKRIVDPQLTSLTDLTQELVSDSGYTILGHRLDFFGICPECREKQKQETRN